MNCVEVCPKIESYEAIGSIKDMMLKPHRIEMDPSHTKPKNLERVRWRARRGLLELDIVLEHFIQAHYATITEQSR